MPLLVGLTGAAGAGKSTCARIMCQNMQFVKVSFAAPLKGMLAGLLSHQGVSQKAAHNYLWGDSRLRETLLPELNGHSVRHAAQTLGTEWGRECMGSTFWTDIGIRGAERAASAGRNVVFDDVRFDDEAVAIRRAGGVVIRVRGISRGGVSAGSSHASEAGVSPELIYHTVWNHSTRAQTQIALMEIVYAMKESFDDGQ